MCNSTIILVEHRWLDGSASVDGKESKILPLHLVSTIHTINMRLASGVLLNFLRRINVFLKFYFSYQSSPIPGRCRGSARGNGLYASEP
jgi:hypothetical protein